MSYTLPKNPRYRSVDAVDQMLPLTRGERWGIWLTVGIIVAVECAVVVALIRGLMR